MLPFWVQNLFVIKGELVICAPTGALAQVIFFLRHHTNALYHTLPDLTAIDYPEHKQRFELVYLLLSPLYGSRVRVKTLLDYMTPLPSIGTLGIFPGSA